MMRKAAVGVAALLLLAGAGWAQEADPDQQATDRDEATEAVAPKIRLKVLENPYDLASFYRSRQDRGYFESEQSGFYGADRYEIARYYRGQSHGGRYGYSRFWTSGYGSSQRRRGAVIGFRRSIGQNGDLFLFAPAILAPVGPLTGAFYDEN
jgi:hypothetical protein